MKKSDIEKEQAATIIALEREKAKLKTEKLELITKNISLYGVIAGLESRQLKHSLKRLLFRIIIIWQKIKERWND